MDACASSYIMYGNVNKRLPVLRRDEKREERREMRREKREERREKR